MSLFPQARFTLIIENIKIIVSRTLNYHIFVVLLFDQSKIISIQHLDSWIFHAFKSLIKSFFFSLLPLLAFYFFLFD